MKGKDKMIYFKGGPKGKDYFYEVTFVGNNMIETGGDGVHKKKFNKLRPLKEGDEYFGKGFDHLLFVHDEINVPA